MTDPADAPPKGDVFAFPDPRQRAAPDGNPFFVPPHNDPVHAIEVAMCDALRKAREMRARKDVPATMMPALVLEEARRAACPSLFRPGLEFSCPEIAQALADAIGRWAQVASAASPEPGAKVAPWPEEPAEVRAMH